MKKIYIIFGIKYPKSPIEWEIHKEGEFVSDFYTRVLEPMSLLNVSQIGIYLKDKEKEIEFFRPSSMFKICNITRGGLKLLLAEKYKLINSLITSNKTATSSALSASIAHEINQPLGAIKTNSQHLNLLIKGKKEKILIKNIIKDNDRIANIITTLKSLFSNNKSIYRSEKFDTFVQALEPIFNESVKDKNIRIKFLLNSSAKVNMNRDELRQVFSNLIQNSIDALSLTSKKNKVIKIKTLTKNNKLFCSVTDNGPGIPRKMQGKIFKLYESSKNSNSGIGLWLSKYIITRHKGSLSVNKAYLSGAEFLIELPISSNV